MPRKRPFNSSDIKPARDCRLNVSSNEDWDELPKFSHPLIIHKNIPRILISHSVAAIYGALMIYTVLKNNHIFNVGSLYFLPVLFIHVMFEYFKCFFFLKRSNSSLKNIREYAFQFLSTHALAVVICYVLAVLFGAELLENIEGTFAFSCIITTFVVVPLFFETETNCLLLLLFQKKCDKFTEEMTLNVSHCVIAGAWFGAFVIPLDWNRPWQIWPTPCVIGALFGYVVGELVSCGRIVLLKLKN